MTDNVTLIIHWRGGDIKSSHVAISYIVIRIQQDCSASPDSLDSLLVVSPASLSVCQSVGLSVCRSVGLSVCQSAASLVPARTVSVPICLSVCLSVCMSVCLPVCR